MSDHLALAAACAREGAIIPVFVWSQDEEGDWPLGGASKWWLHQSLLALDRELRTMGSRLIIRKGETLATLRELIEVVGAKAIFWSRRYEPAMAARDSLIEGALQGDGVEAGVFNAALLREPWTIQNKSGSPFRVFTPFWRQCLSLDDPPEPQPAPEHLSPPRRWPASLPLASLELDARLAWSTGLDATWQPGAAGAQRQLERFLDDPDEPLPKGLHSRAANSSQIGSGFAEYTQARNRPDLLGTSRLSPHLHFGEISPGQVWHGVRQKATRAGWPITQWRQSQFLTELGWREFSHHLLWHFPHTANDPLRPAFQRFPWRSNPGWLKAWQQGQTGYPLVDAGMRELWATGWMHNRVRMVAASFLVKDLLLPWQDGARWFWDTLADADLAQNTLGWQWTAGCGADAAPFFRIFNPIAQGEKFDPLGAYVRRWVPELAGLPNQWIHRPQETPVEVLQEARVTLGQSYPKPIINHDIAREVALEAYARLE